MYLLISLLHGLYSQGEYARIYLWSLDLAIKRLE